MLPFALLQETLAPHGITLTEKQLQQFNTYCSFLVEYNENVNLTAITDPAEVAVKHFADSIIPLAVANIPEGAKLIDVGTGAGFPGVPMKIVRPDFNLTLLDSLQKRLLFLELLCDKIGIESKRVHHRAEQAGADAVLREQFDVATSRAVANLAVLCEYNLPLVRVGGMMVALKGPDCAEEVAAAANAIAILGGKLVSQTRYTVGDSGRTLIIIEKVAPTPKKYPRQRIKISDKPL